MILRRIADGFVRQDWATVGVEFVIVVAGIFLGLEVNNWNELRMERAEERTNLERLLDEAENAVAYIGREVERGAARIAGHRELLETMFSDGPLPEDLTLAERGFMTLSFMPAMAPARTTYDELTAAGGLRLIRSSHVRDMISLYYAELDYFLAQLSYFRQIFLADGNDPTVAASAFVTAEYAPEQQTGRRYVFDWQGLRSDKQLGSLFVRVLRNQVVTNLNRKRLLERAQIMCDAIAAQIDRECEPALGDGSDQETVQPSSVVLSPAAQSSIASTAFRSALCIGLPVIGDNGAWRMPFSGNTVASTVEWSSSNWKPA